MKTKRILPLLLLLLFNGVECTEEVYINVLFHKFIQVSGLFIRFYVL
jgi:hypothetical protein